jgi:hypothetical protein
LSLDETKEGSRVIKGRDGATYTVGDKGMQVGYFKVRSAGKVLVESPAIDSFRFGTMRLEEVLKHTSTLPENLNLVKWTVSQMVIVAVASLLEAYGKKRIVELELENKVKDWKAILKGINYKLPALQVIAKKNARSPIEQLLEERKLNMGDLDAFGRLLEEGFGIKVSDIDREQIYRIISLRQRIVHEGLTSDMLFDAGQGKPPIFATPEVTQDYVRKTLDFVNAVHERTSVR